MPQVGPSPWLAVMGARAVAHRYLQRAPWPWLAQAWVSWALPSISPQQILLLLLAVVGLCLPVVRVKHRADLYRYLLAKPITIPAAAISVPPLALPLVATAARFLCPAVPLKVARLAPLPSRQALRVQQTVATCRLLPALEALRVVPCVCLRVVRRARAAMCGCLAVPALHLAAAR